MLVPYLPCHALPDNWSNRPSILCLYPQFLQVALASRTEEPEWAEEIIHKFKVDDDSVIVDFTHAREIYPKCKVGCLVVFNSNAVSTVLVEDQPI